jgi:molybdopterin-binding protein
VLSLTPDVGRAVLVELDIGGAATVLARITERSSQELGLAVGQEVWALMKAVSLRGQVFSAPTHRRAEDIPALRR